VNGFSALIRFSGFKFYGSITDVAFW
jgi:hypothetical protein